jgi:uncharacterized protein YceH (UPF0502 family)
MGPADFGLADGEFGGLAGAASRSALIAGLTRGPGEGAEFESRLVRLFVFVRMADCYAASGNT